MAGDTIGPIFDPLEHSRARRATLHVTRLREAGLVQITLTPPTRSADDVVNIPAIGATAFTMLTVLSALSGEMTAALFFAGPLAICLVMVITRHDRMARTYVFRAGQDRIIVASSGPLGPRYWDSTRTDLADVRLSIGWSAVGRPIDAEFHPRFIEFDPGLGRTHGRSFALELSPDDFVQLADAVREGLGMPRHRWT